MQLKSATKSKLLQTSALVAVALVIVPAESRGAEKLKVSVGGYMEQWFGYTDIDDDQNDNLDLSGFDVKSDSEIHFKGMTKLDNGLEVGINVQLEANSSSDQIDETYLTVRGNFGKVDIGDENSALYMTHVVPKEYGFEVNSGDTADWSLTGSTSISEAGYFRGPFGGTYIEPNRANDSTKITYYTPRLNGFRFAASYSPDDQQDDNAQPDRNTGFSDGVMAGLDFSKDFGDFDLSASAGYGTFLETAANTDEPVAYAFGLRLGVQNFTLGASFAGFDDHGRFDGNAYMIGGTYDFTSHFGLSLNYFHGERDGIPGDTDPSNAQADQDSYTMGAKYVIGPGVNLAATLGFSEFTSDEAGVGDVESYYLVTGIELSF